MHCLTIQKTNSCLKIIITRIFLRDDKFSHFCMIVPQINKLLKIFTLTCDFTDLLQPIKYWLKSNGVFNLKIFWDDNIHLPKFGNINPPYQFLHYCNSKKMHQRLQNTLLLVQLFVGLSFYLNMSVTLIHHNILLLTSPLLTMEIIPHYFII